MFRLYAKKVDLEVNQREIVTSNSVNVYQCQFQFDNSWDGLEKTAVFQAGEETVSTLLDETGICIIPWEVLQDARRTLYAGVYGTKNGNVVLPTIWAKLCEIKEGVNPGESTQPPTPSVYEQILGNIGNLDELETTAKDSLVDAINEVYETGGGGATGKDGGYYMPHVDDEGNLTWTASEETMPPVEESNIMGPAGQSGGYYIPAVDGDGNLTWSGSELDMPEVDPSNIKGPSGDGIPEIAPEDEGKLLGVQGGIARWVLGGSGSGNVSSADIANIVVMDRADYDNLPEKSPTTLYLIRG